MFSKPKKRKNNFVWFFTTMWTGTIFIFTNSEIEVQGSSIIWWTTVLINSGYLYFRTPACNFSLHLVSHPPLQKGNLDFLHDSSRVLEGGRGLRYTKTPLPHHSISQSNRKPSTDSQGDGKLHLCMEEWCVQTEGWEIAGEHLWRLATTWSHHLRRVRVS